MAVNENVYGLSETWLNCYYQQSALTDKNKKANFGSNNATLLQGVTNSKISYSEPLDKSLSYCGLGTECALSHIAYVGVDSSYTPKILDIQDRFVTNFGFFEKTTNNSFIAPSPIFSVSEMNYITWSSSINLDRNYSPYLEPITKINPHNLVLLIKVRACRSFNSGSIDVDLKTYLTTYKNTHTHIKQVYITAYFGNISVTSSRSADAGQGTPQNRIPLQLAILDEYVHTSKNLKFYMYGFPYMPVFGNFNTSDSVYRNPTNGFGMVAHTENSKEHIKFSTIDGSTIECYTEYYNEFENDILKTVACFGLYFTPVTATAENGALTSSEMYVGLLDGNGIGHGNYLQGADTANAPQNEYTDMTQSGYDHTKEVDKTKYQNDTEFYTSALADGFTRFWVMSSTGVDALLAELYNIMNDDDPDISIERYNMKVFLTQNPIDAVISLKKFPIDNIPSISGAYFINIGAKSTNISASPLAASCGVYTFSFSSASDTSLYPHYNNSFLDYEPYTKAELYIPFCGTYEIPCTYLYDYGGVEVKLIIDFISGACTGYVLCNGICIGSCSGSCAISLPLSGIQSATLDSQIHSASVRDTQRSNTLAASIAAGAVSIAAGIFTGGTGALIGLAAAAVGIGTAAVKSATEQAQIEYEVSHMQTPLKQVSAASGQIAHTYDMRAKLTISRPKISGDYDAEVYANTVGFACIINDRIQNLSGLTQGTVHFKDMVQYDGENNVIATCTDTEKELIRNAFAGGVIL